MLIEKAKRASYEAPPYADFPAAEYEDRLERTRQRMEQERVDALVLWDKSNVRYYTGFHSIHWHALSIQPAVLIVPIDRDPLLIVPEFFRGVAEGLTHVADIRGQDDPHCTEKIRELPVDVATAVIALGHGRGRIGIEAGRLGGMTVPRPINDIDRFRAGLPEATLVEATDLIWSVRMIKSRLEVDAVAQATQAVVEALGRLVAEFRMGMTERDVGILLQEVLVRHAHEIDALNVRCAERRYPMPDTPPFYENVSIEAGDRMVIEPLPMVKGYCGSCCRTFQVGPLSSEAERSVRIIERSQTAAIDAIGPGVSTAELIGVVEKVFEEEGSPIEIEMIGHGMGLTGHEPPMLTAREPTVLEEGMVLAVEIWKYDVAGFAYGDSLQSTKNLGPFGNEDLVVVTADGCERLPAFRKDVLSLPHEPDR
ncbi:M24 family metallopeptidase [Candidatus Bipolaricaulota bacterium]